MSSPIGNFSLVQGDGYISIEFEEGEATIRLWRPRGTPLTVDFSHLVVFYNGQRKPIPPHGNFNITIKPDIYKELKDDIKDFFNIELLADEFENFIYNDKTPSDVKLYLCGKLRLLLKRPQW
ncbi:hypothetical protein FOL47_008308 [Perkinsus chesapeaki]|uniref:Uncharacterized protein n=1 Tax=Perkinsus chesapeaki TaxID=330153 RepID=A0A7J6LEU7_PERCH|nr:hypothetical protein FOL47_008308 [Perkinsus chesapeaki]